MLSTPAGSPASAKISPQSSPPRRATPRTASARRCCRARAARRSSAPRGSAPRSRARSRRRRRPAGAGPSPARRDVGRDHLARRGVGERRRLAEAARDEVHLEHAEAEAWLPVSRASQRDDLVARGSRARRPPSGRCRWRTAGGVCDQRRERRRGGLDGPRARRRGRRRRPCATTSPVNGSRSSNVPPAAASTHSPPMNWRASRTVVLVVVAHRRPPSLSAMRSTGLMTRPASASCAAWSIWSKS